MTSLPPRVLGILERETGLGDGWQVALKSKAEQSNVTWQVQHVKHTAFNFIVKQYLSEGLFKRSLSRTLHLDYFAAEQGIGPKVVFVSKRHQLIGYECLPTSLLSHTSFRSNQIKILAYTLVQIHQLRPKLPALPLVQQLQDYCEILERNDRKLAKVFRQDIQSYLSLIKKSEAAPQVFCHNDLSFEHIFIENKQVKIIDWEYAGYMHPGMDIAMAIVMNDLHEEEIDLLLEAYNTLSKTVNRSATATHESFQITRDELADWLRLVAFVNHLWFKIQEAT